jgi:hypothetical protein
MNFGRVTHALRVFSNGTKKCRRKQKRIIRSPNKYATENDPLADLFNAGIQPDHSEQFLQGFN